MINIQKLSSYHYLKKENLFILSGSKKIRELFSENFDQILKILYSNDKVLDDFEHNTYSKIELTEKISENLMKKISRYKSPPDLIAVGKRIYNYITEESDLSDKILFLNGIQDPGNQGTLIRSCAAFGFKTVILDRNCVDLYNPKFLNSTSGFFSKIKFYISEDNENSLSVLRKNQYIIAGTFIHSSSVKIDEYLPEKKIVLILGSEGQGIDEKLYKYIDTNLKIKTDAGVESLNAGVAGSIIMWQLSK